MSSRVAIEGVLAVGARRGDERQPAALLRAHRRLELGVGDVLVAEELDLPDLDLGVLVDVEVDVDVVLVVALDVGGDLGEVVALLDVEVLDLLDVALDLGRIDDRVLLDVEDLVDLVERDLFRAGDVDLADERLLFDDEDEIDLAAGLLRLDLDVLEVAELPQGAHVVAQLLGAELLARQRLDGDAHGVVLGLVVALELDGADDAPVELRGARRAARLLGERGSGERDEDRRGERAEATHGPEVRSPRRR